MGSVTRFLGWMGMTGMLLFAGCGGLNGTAPAEHRIALQVLYKGSQCGGPTAGAAWIDRPQDLPEPLARLKDLEWAEDQGALWIRMGDRPTGGFELDPAAPTAEVRKKTAVIPVQWRRPAPDRFVFQAFTAPCLLLKMPKAGITRIQVVDQDGQTRAQVELP